MKFIASTFRALALGASVALVALSAISGPVVVTPGSNSGYLYFPPAAAGGGQAAPAAQGVGGVTFYNNQGSMNVTVTAPAAPGASCGPGCNTVNFSTGAGFVKLVATRPSRWTDNGGTPYANCEAALECQVWVNTNTSIVVRAYAICFEPDIATMHTKTCTHLRANNGNAVYSSSLVRVGWFVGVINGTPRVTTANIGYAAPWGCYGVNLGANSATDGKANTAIILAAPCNTPDTAASLCAKVSPAGAWYLPVMQELERIQVSEIVMGGQYFWASTEAGTNMAYAYAVGDGLGIMARSYTGYHTSCFRQYT